MSDFKEMTYEQKIGKAFFDLSQEISNTEIKKLRRQVKKLETKNLTLKQANGITVNDSGLHLQHASNLAKFCQKIAKQEDCPPEFIEIVNKEFWNLI